MHRDVLKVLVTKEEIDGRITEIGRLITEDYKEKNLLLVSVLKGSFVFMADLVRAIDLDLNIDFMIVSSFKGKESTGVVRIINDLTIPIEGLDVLLVEDILDSGRTLEYITSLLKGRNPGSVEICTLLDKPSRRIAEVNAKYTGFTVPDEFVVGYGLDYNEKYRNLGYVGVLKPDAYNTF